MKQLLREQQLQLKLAEKENIKNFFLLSAHKVMPPAMEAIIKEGVNLDGFICPGHVAAITGSDVFNFIPEKYNLGCVITGFEPVDILQSILMLVNQVNRNTPKVEIQYSRAVTGQGNIIAQKTIVSESLNHVMNTGEVLVLFLEADLNLRKEL